MNVLTQSLGQSLGQSLAPLWPQGAGVVQGHAQAAAPEAVSMRRLALSSADDLAALRSCWEALAARSASSFFLTWRWIGVWLHSLPQDTDVRVLQAEAGGRIVGLALLVRHGLRRVKGVPVVPAWYLHSTGDAALDKLYIEHNGFLVDADWRGRAEPAMLQHWWQHTRGTRELWLPRLADGAWREAWGIGLTAGARPVSCDSRALTSYAVDLNEVRRQGGNHLLSRSSNLRSQIRRTLKAYGEVGEVVLDVAASSEQALAFLDRLMALHQAHWQSRGQPGAFADPWFVAFHRSVVLQGAANGGVQLLRLRAGEQEIAYLYSFVHEGRVYFYQSGMNYGLGGKHGRPGYAAHVLAIEFNARLGHAFYDFMDGDDRYKRDLANVEERMHQVVLRTPSRRHRLELAVRAWLGARA